MSGIQRHMDLETASRFVVLLQEGNSQRSVALSLRMSRYAYRNRSQSEMFGIVIRRPVVLPEDKMETALGPPPPMKIPHKIAYLKLLVPE